MKKKVEVKFKDQWELAVALKEGREIYWQNLRLSYIETKTGSPFYVDTSVMDAAWNVKNHAYYEMVEAPWTDRLKDGPIRCWVSDKNLSEAEMIEKKYSHNITTYRQNDEFPFLDSELDSWKYAIPAKAKDLNLLENMEDV